MPKTKRSEPLGDSDHGPARGPNVNAPERPLPRPGYEAFASLGPLPPETAHEWAVNFESRTLYRDDLRWLVDSYLDALRRLRAALSGPGGAP